LPGIHRFPFSSKKKDRSKKVFQFSAGKVTK
jgi:hypothetical protein